MAREYLIPGQGYINETGTREYLIPGQGYVNETVASSAVTALSWLPVYNARVNPALLSAQNTTFAKPIAPSPISQTNWYPIYDARVAAPATAARYNFLSKPITPSPISQTNWYPVYDPRLKPVATGASFITPPIPTIAAIVTVINWLPTYDAKVRSAALNAGNSAFSENLATPLTITNWYPAYRAEVKTVLLAAKFSIISQLLSSPITINNWQPTYAAEVKTPAGNSVTLTVMPVPAIAAAFSPISWYPGYSPDLAKTAAIAQCGTIQPFDLIAPAPPVDDLVLLGGKAYDTLPHYQKRPYYNYSKEYERLELAEKHAELRRIDDELATAERAQQAKATEYAKLEANNAAKELAALEAQLQEEINRLRMERVWLMRLIDDDEAILVLLLSSPLN